MAEVFLACFLGKVSSSSEEDTTALRCLEAEPGFSFSATVESSSEELASEFFSIDTLDSSPEGAALMGSTEG